MKLKNYAYRCMAVVCAVVAVSCVDENFSFDKVSKEVSVIDGETILPLGSLEKQTLGGLLGSDTELPEGIVKNEDGSYEFRYEIPTEIVSAGEFELPTSFEISEMGSTFNVELPTLDFDSYRQKIEEDFGLNLTGGLSDYLGDAAELEVTELMLKGLEASGIETSLNAHIAEVVKIDAIEFELPKQIKNVSTIHFKDIEEGHMGAPLHVDLDMNGLAGVNGGGHFTFVLEPTETDLVIYDNDGNPIERNENNEYRVEMDIDQGDEDVKFALFIESLVNKNDPENGVISIDPTMSFYIDLKLDAKPGIMKAGAPVVSVRTEFALEDAEVVFDSNVDLVNIEFGGENGADGFGFEIDALPEQIKSINRIGLDSESVLSLYAEGFDWLEGNSDCVTIDMTLPECLELKPMGDYQYDAEKHMLTMTIGDISEGLQIGVEAIDFGEEGLSSADGPISIDFNPSVRVHFTNDEPISINNFISNGAVDIAVGLHPTTLGFESVTAKVYFSESIEEDIDLGDLTGELPIEIEGSGLSPVLMVTISNPLTLDANIVAQLIPYVGDEAQESKMINFNATIKGATKDELSNEIVPTTTTIVLAKESQEANYPASEGYTFVKCNLDNLISTPLPDRIALSASFGLPQDAITLYLGDIENLEVSYSASLSLPFAFDSQLGISYEDTVDILDEKGNSPLAEVASINGIKVGDIAIIAEYETTLPLELEVETTLYDKSGNELPTKIGFGDGSNVIAGSADGTTPQVSTLRMQFDLADEDGSLAELAEIASIGFKVAACSSVEEGVVALKEEQYIAAELKLEIDGGITVDFAEVI